MDDLSCRLLEAFSFSQHGSTIVRADDPLIDRIMMAGLETRTDPRVYQWDGMKRGGDEHHPNLVFQYTLSGYGCYAAGGQLQHVPPGHAFMAVIPSAHRYYLPPESPAWSFFFLLLRHHDYVIARFADAVRRYGAVTPMPPDSVVLARAVALFEGICLRSFPDSHAAEQALFDFLLEYERHMHRTAVPPTQRERLLLSVRQYVLGHLNRPVSVEELASLLSMSRSNYTHHFRTTTGLSPAHYVSELRLQEASRRLLHTRLNLKMIAAETGFADANHFCKAFRRAHQISPNQYRKQYG